MGIEEKLDNTMRYLPLFKNVRGRPCLVVGGGPVAQRKIQMLLRARATVTVVAPDATEDISGWNGTGRVVWTKRRFDPGDVKDRILVFSATGDATVDKAVSSAARAVHSHTSPSVVADPGMLSSGQWVVVGEA